MGLKMPRITIEFQEDTNDAVGKISVGFVLGFALRLFWPFLAILGEYTFSSEAAAEYAPILNLASIITFGLTMLAYGVFLNQIRRAFATPRQRDFNRLMAACIIAFGVVLIAVANAQPHISCPVLIIAGALTGIGSAMLMMSYGASASICDVASVGLSAALSFTIALALYALVSCTCQGLPWLCCSLAAVVPFIEWFCLHMSSKNLIDRLKFVDMTVPVRLAPFSLHITLPCLFFGIALAACRLQVMDLSNDGDASMAGAMVLGAVAAAFFIALAVLTQRHNANFMPRLLMPLIAAGLLVISVVQLPGTNGFAFFFTSFYIFIACSVWVTLADVSQRFRISVFTVFGFGYGALLIGEAITFGVDVVGGPLDELFLTSPNITALLFFLLVTGTALLPLDSELRRTFKVGRRCPGLTSGDIDRDLVFEQTLSAKEQIGALQGEEQERGGAAEDAAETPSAVVAADAASAAGTENAMGQPGTQGVTQAAGRAKEEDERFAQVEAEDKEHEETDGPLGKKGRYKRKCAIVADTYLLSRKETEVLFLLAKGRNAAAIQEALYIAAGTANTHMRHIYRKLDVHSQQELIELVESVELEDEE